MKTIESFLNKATEADGFHKLPGEEATMLDNLSKLAEAYEDNTLKLMFIIPSTLQRKHSPCASLVVKTCFSKNNKVLSF